MNCRRELWLLKHSHDCDKKPTTQTARSDRARSEARQERSAPRWPARWCRSEAEGGSRRIAAQGEARGRGAPSAARHDARRGRRGPAAPHGHLPRDPDRAQARAREPRRVSRRAREHPGHPHPRALRGHEQGHARLRGAGLSDLRGEAHQPRRVEADRHAARGHGVSRPLPRRRRSRRSARDVTRCRTCSTTGGVTARIAAASGCSTVGSIRSRAASGSTAGATRSRAGRGPTTTNRRRSADRRPGYSPKAGSARGRSRRPKCQDQAPVALRKPNRKIRKARARVGKRGGVCVRARGVTVLRFRRGRAQIHRAATRSGRLGPYGSPAA